jgi:hypothetical protein
MRQHEADPDHIAVVRSKTLWLSNDAKIGLGRLGAIFTVAPSDFAQTRDALFGIGKCDMAAADSGASTD